MRSATEFRQEGLEHSWYSNLSQVFNSVEVSAGRYSQFIWLIPLNDFTQFSNVVIDIVRLRLLITSFI